MVEAYKHRALAAPRVAEEVPAVVHHNGDSQHHDRLARGLSAARCSGHRSSSRRRDCRCFPRLLPLLSRKRTRHFSALVLLFLAGTFSLRGWRAAMMIDSTPFGVGRWSTSSPAGFAEDQRSQCAWASGGPIMFDVRHSKTHADAAHWFHAAECFIGRRQDFKDYISGMDGTDVYLKDSDVAWNSKLTPMSRLFMMAGLTSVGVRAVHFVDGNHASFSFPPSPKKIEGGGNAATGAWMALRGGDSHAGATPQPGQVGMLSLDDVGHRGQFVVSPDQPLPYRLTVSAPGPPVRAWDGRGGRGGVARGGGGGAGEDSQKCVKFAGTVGDQDRDREQTRPDWFPGEGEEGPRELLRAFDNFCPISWLRREQQERTLATDDGAVPADSGDGGSGGDGWARRRVSRGLYATVVGGPGQGARGGLGFGAGVKQVIAKSRNLVIYQREDGRQLLNTDELSDELWDRLGHLGWKITEIVHDDHRHPCDLIEELAGADALLTAHGFQSMLSVFMPPGSVLFEVYPHKYFRDGHTPLLQSLGIRYDFSESPPQLPLTSWAWPSRETCMKWSWCRWYVRRSDVVIDEESVEVLISYMLKSLPGR